MIGSERSTTERHLPTIGSERSIVKSYLPMSERAKEMAKSSVLHALPALAACGRVGCWRYGVDWVALIVIKTTWLALGISHSTPKWRAIERNGAWAKAAIANWLSLANSW
jgi:hypothetical protein